MCHMTLSIYTNHNPIYMKKSVPGRKFTLPAESTLSSIGMTKKLLPLTKLTAGPLSSEFTQTFLFLQAFNDRLHQQACNTTSSVLARVRFWLNFFSQLQFLHMLSESTFCRVDLGRRAKVYTWQKVFPGRRMTLPSKASDPARQVLFYLQPSQVCVSHRNAGFD